MESKLNFFSLPPFQSTVETSYSLKLGGLCLRLILNCGLGGLFRVPWTARRSNWSILKFSPGISLEGMMLKLKLQYFGYLMRRVNSSEKTDAGRDWGQEEKGMTEDEMAGWMASLTRWT